MAKNLTLAERIAIFLCLSIVITSFITSSQKRHINKNELIVIKYMRHISIMQAQYQPVAWVDQDVDGIGEHATLGELSGIKRRNSRHEKEQRTRNNPTHLSPIFWPKGSKSTVSGYHFQIFLPGKKDNVPITDNGSEGLKYLGDANAIDAQEKKYRAYAWPVKYNKTGKRCFAIDQKGILVAASNQDSSQNPLYQGNNGPKFDAAVSNTPNDEVLGSDGRTFIGIITPDKVAVDGQIWKEVENQGKFELKAFLKSFLSDLKQKLVL